MNKHTRLLVQRTNVSRALVVINDLLVISTRQCTRSEQPRSHSSPAKGRRSHRKHGGAFGDVFGRYMHRPRSRPSPYGMQELYQTLQGASTSVSARWVQNTHTHTPLLSNAALFDSFLLILVEFSMLRAAELSTPTGQSLQQLHLLQRPARLHRTNGRSDQHREGRRVGVPVRLPRPVFRRRTHRTLSPSLDRKAYGEQAKYFEDEIRPTLKHTSMGTVGMASVGENLNCSQARSRHCRATAE